ncbi:MAG TPA: hypothetical protein VEQ66_12260 [Propionibacteriaceae bacterium]|nr:hypothetical protein [Propionibacteriaceae bacterium]
MALLAQVLVLLHLIGFAALLGGALVQLRLLDPEVNATMLHGAWTSLVTGAGLVTLAVLDGGPLPYAQLAVKLAVGLFVVLLVSVNRRFSSIPRGLLALIAGLTLADAGVAVLWR